MIINHQSSFVSHRSSVINHQYHSSVIVHQSSIIRIIHQSSFSSQQSSICGVEWGKTVTCLYCLYYRGGNESYPFFLSACYVSLHTFTPNLACFDQHVTFSSKHAYYNNVRYHVTNKYKHNQTVFSGFKQASNIGKQPTYASSTGRLLSTHPSFDIDLIFFFGSSQF